MPLVSFIIPLFKAEKFLSVCLTSIQNQSLSNIEIICINDNSPDKSLSIVKSFLNVDNRIKLIDLKKNMGAGYARNKGMELATGKYLRMVDPDDFIPINSTEKLLNVAQQHKSDFVRGGFWRCRSDGSKLKNGARYPSKKLINGSFHKNRELWYLDQHCTYLYNAKIVKESGSKYAENIRNGEDIVFLIQLAPYMKKVTLLPETVYCYRRNPDSTMLSHKNEQYYLNLFHLYEMEYQLLGTNGYREQIDNFLFYHLAVVLPKIVFPSIPVNLRGSEAIFVLTQLKKVFERYNIDRLCFSSQYSWQESLQIPLLTRQVVALLSANYLEEAYETIKKHARNNKIIKRQQKLIHSMENSSSWYFTSPLRWLKHKASVISYR